ncbi:hypothetical protein OROHE_026266 [Orobanche hederae]
MERSHHSQPHHSFERTKQPLEPTQPLDASFQQYGTMFDWFQGEHPYRAMFDVQSSSSQQQPPFQIEQPVFETEQQVSDRYSCERDVEGDVVGESVGQLGERSLPPRVSRPSAALREPFVVAPPRDSEALKRSYLQFRSQPADAIVRVLETGHVLTQALFERIESSHEDFDAKVIDCYVLATRARLWRGVRNVGVGRVGTVLAGSQFYVISYGQRFAKLHPDDPLGLKVTGKPVYKGWKIPKCIEDLMTGLDTPNAVLWSNCDEIIAICCLNGSHWVTIKINIITWTVELYDSLSQHHEEGQYRFNQMRPITRLMPRVLSQSVTPQFP